MTKPSKPSKPSKPAAELREFKAHSNLIRQAVLRQAGTLDKALLEGVMNSEDAGATAVYVTVTEKGGSITDDGRGFATRQQIEESFETFGNPHAMDDQGCSTDAKFGAFRIGRGQLFAFGHNVWHSGNFTMDVNLPKATSLSYELTEHPRQWKGCNILLTWTVPLLTWQVESAVRELAKACRFMDIPVVINEVVVNAAAQGWTWDLETPEFKLQLDKKRDLRQGILIYNQGVLVEMLHDQGTSGVVVTKVQVPLNTARNQVMRQSAVWRRISTALREELLKRVTKTEPSKELDRASCYSLVRRVWEGEFDLKSLHNVRFLLDTNGNKWSPAMLARRAKDFLRQIDAPPIGVGLPVMSMAEPGNKVADRLLQRKLALVLDATMLEGVTSCGQPLTPERFIGRLGSKFKFFTWAEAEALIEGSKDHHLIPLDQCKPKELDALHDLKSALWSLIHAMREPGFWRYQNRLLRLGTSETADGWTDGQSYIAISRHFLAANPLDTVSGRAAMVLLLAHELTHDASSLESHVHGQEFYTRYHDMTRQGVPRAMMDLQAQVKRSELRKAAKAKKKTP